MDLINDPSNLLTVFLLYFTSFFTIINPIGSIPVFMTLTYNLTEEEKSRTSKKANLTAFLTLILFAFTGHFLFKFFGISVDSLRIVGGVIFFIMGYDMLQAKIGRVKLKDDEITNYVNNIAITPLAIPLICGPGAITNAIVLMEDTKNIESKLILIIAILLVLILNFILQKNSTLITKIIGDTGINVLMRLMGLIMMVIAVDFFFAGLTPILKGIFNL